MIFAPIRQNARNRFDAFDAGNRVCSERRMSRINVLLDSDGFSS
jgi:hypothetical protein